MADQSAAQQLAVNWRDILKWGALIGISDTWKSLGEGMQSIVQLKYTLEYPLCMVAVS